MKLSKKFVNDYTKVDDYDTLELTDKMVKIGNEADSITSLVKANKLVIGKVIECKSHPESDHLHICKVDIGKEKLNIVCGAPNVKEGLKVIVALEGAVVGSTNIKKTVILGIESNGMLCSLAELGIENKYLSKKDIDGIHEFNDDAPIGEDAIKYLELDDEIIDFELTSNRGDLLSMMGLAYEISALTNKEVKEPKVEYKEIKDNVNDEVTLKVDTKNVYTFLVKKVKDVVIKESPLFIKNRLIACGIRPINNVVDISNYVMLETGQPLHFYDADLLGNTIEPRMAENNEKVTTLDNIERILSKDDIVITNGKNTVGLAGVMGGLNTEINDNTKNITIESAIFNPLNIRLTSKKILRSEASSRYEKGLDVNRCYLAIERACTLLSMYASGKVCTGTIEYNTLDRENKIIKISLEKINKVIGKELTSDDVLDCFNKLKFKTKFTKGIFDVEVPTRRIDISIEEDLIEEVGRIYGVDNIESSLPIFESTPGIKNKNKTLVKNIMSSLGLNEVITYSLINVKDVFKFTNDEFGLIKVLDPMTPDHEVLRHSIINSLLEVYDYNKARSTKDLSIFEVSKCFSLINGEYIEEEKLSFLLTGKYNIGLNTCKYDFYTARGIVENLLDSLGYQGRYSFVVKPFPEEMHPTKTVYITINGNIIGFIGQVHPRLYKEEIYVCEINLQELFKNKLSKLKYKEFSKYPGISKDMAFIISKDITSEQIIETIRSKGGKLLKKVEVFDYYEGDKIDNDKKSIAYNLYFESNERTLTDEEVNTIFESIIEEVIKKHNAILRDK